MKRRSTFFARGFVYFIGLGALAVCLILVPELAREDAIAHPGDYLIYPFLIGAYAIATPFFIALYQTLKLFSYIDRGTAFSPASIRALKRIKYCALTVAALITLTVVVGLSLIRAMDPQEDSAPLGAIGFVFAFAATVVAAFVATLQQVLQQAITIKSENDLIV